MKTHPILITIGALWAAASAFATNPPAPTDPELIERGRHIVEAVAMCVDCHTPRLPTGQLDPDHALQGAALGFAPLAEMPWAPAAPSIAGLAGRNEADVLHLLTRATRPDGTAPLPPMPAYRMSVDEARAVIAYLRSLPSS